MLGAEHAVTQPKGLKALIIANSPASMALWLQGAAKLRAQLPADVQQTLLDHEAAGTLDSAEYKAASAVFYQRHVCRLDHGRRKCGAPSMPWMPTRRFITP